MLGGVDRFLLQRPRERRVARLGRPSPAPSPFVRALRSRCGTVSFDRGFRVDVEVGEDQRLLAASAAALRPSPCPRARGSRRSGLGAARGPASAPVLRAPPPGRAAGSRTAPRARSVLPASRWLPPRRCRGRRAWSGRAASRRRSRSPPGRRGRSPRPAGSRADAAAATIAAASVPLRGVPFPLLPLLPTRGSLARRGYGRSEPMRKNVLRTAVLTVVAVLAMGGVALAIVLRAGSARSDRRKAASRRRRCRSTRRRRSPCTAKARSGPPTARCRRS